MALIGIEISNNKQLVGSQLMHYAISLFEGCDSEILNFKELTNDCFSKINTAELFIFALTEETKISTIAKFIEILSKENLLTDQPFFLLATGLSEHSDKLHQTIKFIEQKGGIVWDSYLLPHAQDNFNSKEGVIKTISLRLQLMRKVNQLRYEKLGIDDQQNSCGIERDKGEYGDESGH